GEALGLTWAHRRLRLTAARARQPERHPRHLRPPLRSRRPRRLRARRTRRQLRGARRNWHVAAWRGGNGARYGSGIAQIERFWNVAVPPSVLYFAVKVVLPGLRPVRTNDALACWKLLPRRLNALVSVA